MGQDRDRGAQGVGYVWGEWGWGGGGVGVEGGGGGGEGGKSGGGRKNGNHELLKISRQTTSV